MKFGDKEHMAFLRKYQKTEDKPQLPYQYKHFTPRAMGIMDAMDQMRCQPSMYYTQRQQQLDYIAGYLSVKPHDRGARVIGGMHGLDLPSSEQEEAEATARRILDALWKLTFDEMYADALAVDAAQGGDI